MQQHSDSRFDRLSREILDGSLPYGPLPGQPPYAACAVVFEHDEVPSAVLIVALTPEHGLEAALSISRVHVATADRVLDDVKRFMEEAQRGECGEMLPFSFLPRRVAIRRLKRLLHAH